MNDRADHEQTPPASASDPKVGVAVHFREADFMKFVRKLYRTYPDEWIAIAVEYEDRETGETSGTIIAHSGGLDGMAPASAYHRANPERIIRMFSTRMVQPVPRGW